jgi:hypothetical protein
MRLQPDRTSYTIFSETKQMSSLLGIVHDKAEYLAANVKTGAAGIRIKRLARLPANPFLRSIRLYSKSANFAMESCWLKSTDIPDLKNITAEKQSTGSFTSVCRTPELAFHSAQLNADCSLASCYDTYLAVLPPACAKDVPASFVSAFACAQHWRIGVIINGELQLSVLFAPNAADMLYSHLERLKIYWASAVPDTPFPAAIYIMGNTAPESGSHIRIVPQGLENASEFQYAAAGAALLKYSSSVKVPEFPFTGISRRVFRIRKLILSVSAIFIIAGLAASILSSALKYTAMQKNRETEKRYRAILENNSEIKDELKRANTIAESLQNFQKQLRNVSSWSVFLRALSRELPQGVIINRLGSQPGKKGFSTVSVALSGTAADKTSVTELIDRLSRVPGLSDVKLLSIENIEGEQNSTGFRILCEIKSSEH